MDILMQFDRIPAFAQYGTTISDWYAVFSDFGQHRQGQVEQMFRDETDPYGDPWTPLSSAYLAYKVRSGKITKIMQSSGIMRASWNYDPSPDRYVEGFASKLAEFHQRGAGNLPERLLLPTPARGLPTKDEAELSDLVMDYAGNQWRNL